MMNMNHEEMSWINHELYHKQHAKFKAFLVNLVLMILVWLLCKSGMMDWAVANAEVNGDFLRWQCMMGMGLWKILNIVFFLAPAIAIWWERKCIEHHHYNTVREEQSSRQRRR